MQRKPFQKEIHLPYSKWSQHRANNGLIYLAHPVTGEVKWLWSRHHDPKTAHDYLVNTITGKRQWVTKENAHFCPVKPNTQVNPSPNSKPENIASTTTNPLANSMQQLSVPATIQSSSATKQFLNMPTAPAKVATAPKQNSADSRQLKYREIAAPKSLGLTADEVLMLVPETGRRYIFNKKTKTSRWLPDRPPDTVAKEKRQKPLFGRSKAPKQIPSPPNDDDSAHPELKVKTQVSEPTTLPHGNTVTNGVTTEAVGTAAKPHVHTDAAAMPDGRDVQMTHVQNEQGDGNEISQPGVGDDDGDEVDQVSCRLGALNTILADVSKMTTSDKYNMSHLRTLSKQNSPKEEAHAGSQRLLELEEYLTQQMLKVDAVESEGNQVIRAKRKETVKAILALTEEIERLREELSS